MRKHKKFYRPKDEKKYTAENGQHVYKKYVSQFMDCIDFGIQKGKRKSHRLINTYLLRKNPRSTNNISLRVTKPKKYNYNFSHTQYIGSIEEHLKGDYFLYYQCRPGSFIHLINDDFDSIKNPSDTLTDDIYYMIKFLRESFPDSYFDLGSSGRSLNHFKLVSSESLYDYFMFEYDDECRFPRFINKILNSMSRIYRFIYNTNTSYSLPPNLKFDSIKGTLSDYEWYRSKKNGKTYYKRIIHSGQFAKLPRPTSVEQYRTFYNMNIYDILYLMDVAMTRYIISLYSYSVDSLVNILSVRSSSFSRIHYNACKAALYLCEIMENVKRDPLYNDPDFNLKRTV